MKKPLTSAMQTAANASFSETRREIRNGNLRLQRLVDVLALQEQLAKTASARAEAARR
jgi:hypothetical protein